jgi:chromosome segregation ATPase
MMSSTIFYIVASMLLILLGAIIHAMFPVFSNTVKENDSDVADTNSVSVDALIENRDKLLAELSQLESDYSETRRELNTLKIASVAESDEISKWQKANLELRDTLKEVRSRLDTYDNLIESNVTAYLYESELVTITNVSTKKVKDVKEDGKSVTLYYFVD